MGLHNVAENNASVDSRKLSSKEKKLRRREELVKKKAVDEAIKSAYMKDDHLVGFPAFHTYDRNGLLVRLESGSGEHLSSPLKRYIQELLKVNMQGAYGPEWAAEEKIKRREMVAPEARYIFVRSMQSADNEHLSNINNMEEVHECHWSGDGDPVVAFVHYRFIVEEEIPVVYVYELQLEQCVQGRGLGKFLMQLIELIARKNHMKAVMLTVQKRNISAMNFYTSKLRYIISSISPSRVDPLIGAEKSYEILCKTFDSEAKTKLEEDGSSGAE
jgi:GNAT superfamily N-acetyltransferase